MRGHPLGSTEAQNRGEAPSPCSARSSRGSLDLSARGERWTDQDCRGRGDEQRAETIRAARVPNRKACVCPISDPNSATPSTLPVCRVELSTPAAMPERALSTLPSSVEVSGGTKRPRPPPIATSCAHDRPIAGAAARCPSSARQPAAAIKAPAAMVAGAPNRSAIRGASEIDRQHRAHHRHEGQTGREGRPAVDLLEVQAEDEDQSVKRDIDQKADERSQREHAVREQRQRQHGMPACGVPAR